MIIRDVTFKAFENETRDRKLICIGCGKLLEYLFEFWDTSITKRVELVADNYKNGTTIDYQGTVYKVLKVDEISAYCTAFHSIIVTTMYCEDIVKQLNDLCLSNDIKVYLYPVMSRRVDEYKMPTASGNKIPKIIHWMWVGGGQIPEKNKRCIESWYKFCPDYEIKCWTEKEYDVTRCKYMMQAYEKKKWGFVPDYARLDIIYNEGGIYLDTDVEMTKSFDDLLGFEGFMGFQRNYFVNLGLGFGAAKGNLLIRNMMEAYEFRDFIVDGKMDMTASPELQTRTLRSLGLKCTNELQNISGCMIFPTDVFDPKGSPIWNTVLTPHSHSIHHYDESWSSEEQKYNQNKKYRQVEAFL